MLFAYRLALALGIWDVEAMLRDMSGAQLRGWMEFAQADPFGDERADLRSAIIAMTVANAAGGKTKVEDFMPKFSRPRKTPQSWQGMKAILRQASKAIAAAEAAGMRQRG